ncbi:hypothetical protein [Jeotgalibacillus sp. R-1-5s-1]|uniref:DoxX family protein n=1 Tax=Jeotgalibacillus sp. R-1-5s-1 TaxID=2555897 RepID=UPI001FC7BCA8|nr:hypothetical protein [Jeotgalibacillus sp. R-1-5s-1]
MLKRVYGAFILFAGVMHFLKERNFRYIVPKFLPFRKAIVLVSGVAEIIIGGMLVLNKGTKLAGKLLGWLMIAVWPANMYMAYKEIPLGKIKLSPAVLWGRVAFQIPLIKWAFNISKNAELKN